MNRDMNHYNTFSVKVPEDMAEYLYDLGVAVTIFGGENPMCIHKDPLTRISFKYLIQRYQDFYKVEKIKGLSFYISARGETL